VSSSREKGIGFDSFRIASGGRRHLHLSRREVRVFRARGAAADDAAHREDELHPQGVGLRVRFRRG